MTIWEELKHKHTKSFGEAKLDLCKILMWEQYVTLVGVQKECIKERKKID